jgi:hypothetical protein
MSSTIYSSTQHAQVVGSWKSRLRAGAAVDALDDTGNWVRATVMSVDTNWGKVQVKYAGRGGTSAWMSTAGDRLRPPGEMTHASGGGGGGAGGLDLTAAGAAHMARAAALWREAVLMWLLVLGIAAAAAFWVAAPSSSYGLWALAVAVGWFSAVPRTGRWMSEARKGGWGGSSQAAQLLPQSVWWSLLPRWCGQMWQFRWVKRGQKLDFRNRSETWVKAEVLDYPFPWTQVYIRFETAGRATTEWVGVNEERLLPAGQMTGQGQQGQQMAGGRSAGPSHDLDGTFSNATLEMAMRQANVSPMGHTPTSSRPDGLRDTGGYGAPHSTASNFGSPFGISGVGAAAAAPSSSQGGAAAPSPGKRAFPSFTEISSPLWLRFTEVKPVLAKKLRLKTPGAGGVGSSFLDASSFGRGSFGGGLSSPMRGSSTTPYVCTCSLRDAEICSQLPRGWLGWRALSVCDSDCCVAVGVGVCVGGGGWVVCRWGWLRP